MISSSTTDSCIHSMPIFTRWSFPFPQLLRESPHALPMIFSSLLRAGLSQCSLHTASRPPQVLLLQTKESHFSVLNSRTSTCDSQSSALHHWWIGRSAASRPTKMLVLSWKPNYTSPQSFQMLPCSHCWHCHLHAQCSFTANCMSGRSWRHAVCTCCKLSVCSDLVTLQQLRRLLLPFLLQIFSRSADHVRVLQLDRLEQEECLWFS